MCQRFLLCLACFMLSFHAFASMEDTQRAVWANEAIIATYTYNYKNFLQQQKEIATYFSANGWIAYNKALDEAKLPETVKHNSYDVSAVATTPPTITSLRENYWQAVMPILVVYKNFQSQQKQHLKITIEFSTSPAGQGVRGYSILSLQAKSIQPACECPAEKPDNTQPTSPK